MKNSNIEKFINHNLDQYLMLGSGKSKNSVEELRKLLKILREENIFQIEEILHSLENHKIRVLTAKLCSMYALEVLNKEKLSELINSISEGLNKSIPSFMAE